jgi:hypothetical protein
MAITVEIEKNCATWFKKLGESKNGGTPGTPNIGWFIIYSE